MLARELEPDQVLAQRNQSAQVTEHHADSHHQAGALGHGLQAVALLDMLHFVRQHAGDFFGARSQSEQAAMHHHEPARHREGIDRIIVRYMKFILVGRALGQTRADFTHHRSRRPFDQLQLGLGLRECRLTQLALLRHRYMRYGPGGDAFMLPQQGTQKQQWQKYRTQRQRQHQVRPFAGSGIAPHLAAALQANLGRRRLRQLCLDRGHRRRIGHRQHIAAATSGPFQHQLRVVETAFAHVDLGPWRRAIIFFGGDQAQPETRHLKLDLRPRALKTRPESLPAQTLQCTQAAPAPTFLPCIPGLRSAGFAADFRHA